MSILFPSRREHSTIVEGQRLFLIEHHGTYVFQTAFFMRNEQNVVVCVRCGGGGGRRLIEPGG